MKKFCEFSFVQGHYIINLFFVTCQAIVCICITLFSGTKDSLPTIKQNNAHELYSYITGITRQKNSHLYRINGVENHLHILTGMNPSIAPADFVKDIKVSFSIWMKKAIYFLDLMDGLLDMVLLPVHTQN